jgi:hypothetical protein
VNKILFIIVAAITVVSLTSCRTYNSKADYFDGNVLVEYNQTTHRSEDDTITFTFYDEGDYSVKFSYTDGNQQGASALSGPTKLPADFTFTVKDNPRTKVVSQYVLPGFLTVAITHNEITEIHNFK